MHFCATSVEVMNLNFFNKAVRDVVVLRTGNYVPMHLFPVGRKLELRLFPQYNFWCLSPLRRRLTFVYPKGGRAATNYGLVDRWMPPKLNPPSQIVNSES